MNIPKTTKLDEAWQKVLGLLELPNHRGLFLLGNFARRVTVYSQQVRALNLVDSLAGLGRISPQSNVAVVGAGMGGLTVSAALAQEARRAAKEARKKFAVPSAEREIAIKAEEANLRMVIEEMEGRLQSIDAGSLSERGLQAELGDCYGVLGGLYRDWERFEDAASCYHEGRKCEARFATLGGKSNSYCLVQELVNRLLSDPSRLRELEFKKLLSEARAEVQLQMAKDRAKDVWAKADLAVLSLLISPDESIQQWDEFDDLNPPQFAYMGTREVLLTLLERLGEQLTAGDKTTWRDTIERLGQMVRT